MLRCNFKRHKNCNVYAVAQRWDVIIRNKISKEVVNGAGKNCLSSTEERLEKLFRKLGWFTMSRRAGNSCLLQSSWPFPCTRILPVVINTVITTGSSSGEAVSLRKLMTILSHFEAEWLLSAFSKLPCIQWHFRSIGCDIFART